MNKFTQRPKTALSNRTRARRFALFALVSLATIVGLSAYFTGPRLTINPVENNAITLSAHYAPPESLTLAPQRGSRSPNPDGSRSPNPGTTGCGSVRNRAGAYTFSWLHVSNGRTLDDRNCPVHLLGLNMGGLFLGAAGHAEPQVIAWYKQHIPMNVVREAFNAYWWNADVYVPNQRMHFRQWLQTVVSWQEAQGNYVILDDTTQFHNPPCGDDGMGYHVSHCPSQNQAEKNYPPDPTEKETYQPTALPALASLATLYANDPAVIFDVWNEPTSKQLQGIPEQTYLQDMNARINTVRRYDPRALVMVFDHDLSAIASGKFPDYAQPNLLWDTHIYGANWSTSNGISTNVAFAHNRNQAFIIGEWGGSSGIPSPSTIIPYIRSNAIASTYFFSTNLINGSPEKPTSLNSIGQAVANGYAAIFASP